MCVSCACACVCGAVLVFLAIDVFYLMKCVAIEDVCQGYCSTTATPWLARMSARGIVVLLPPLASEDVRQGYCSTTATPG